MALQNPIHQLLLDEICRVHSSDTLSSFQLPAETRLFLPAHDPLPKGISFTLLRFDGNKFSMEDKGELELLWDGMQNADQKANLIGWGEHNWYFIPALLFLRPIAFLLVRADEGDEKVSSKLYLAIQDITEKCLAAIFDKTIYEAIQFEHEEEVAKFLITKLEACILPAGLRISRKKSDSDDNSFCTQLLLEYGSGAINTLYVIGEPYVCTLRQANWAFTDWKHQVLVDSLRLQFKRLIHQWEQGRALMKFILAPPNIPLVVGLPPNPTWENNYDNAFFYDNHSWVVWFKGKSCPRKVNSQQGMHALHILLSTPGIHSNPEMMHIELMKRETKYNVSSNSEISDPGLDVSRRAEAKDRYEAFLSEWNRIKNRAAHECVLGDAQILGIFIAQLDILLDFYPGDFHYIGERTKASKKLFDIQLVLGIDENFAHKYRSALKPERKTGNAKNRLDSIRKAIQRAILNYKEEFPELYVYLSNTIIVTNKNGVEASYKPFVYVPELASDQNILWITKP